jgi:hypothetical protein
VLPPRPLFKYIDLTDQSDKVIEPHGPSPFAVLPRGR